ncbi:MAG: hypothetical protein JSV03_16025, partial [Planctomycetota bacterium]
MGTLKDKSRLTLVTFFALGMAMVSPALAGTHQWTNHTGDGLWSTDMNWFDDDVSGTDPMATTGPYGWGFYWTPGSQNNGQNQHAAIGDHGPKGYLGVGEAVVDYNSPNLYFFFIGTGSVRVLAGGDIDASARSRVGGTAAGAVGVLTVEGGPSICSFQYNQYHLGGDANLRGLWIGADGGTGTLNILNDGGVSCGW